MPTLMNLPPHEVGFGRIHKVFEVSSQKIFLSNWKEARKNQAFNGIQTRDLRDTGAMLYQLSYEATHWERGQFIKFIFSRAVQ